MNKVLCITALFITLSLSSAVYAECSDKPSPGVEWERCYLDKRQFVNSNLRAAKLRGAYLARSDFSNANLSDIDGRLAKFVNSILVNARLDNARLVGADFTSSNLKGTSFRGADLRRAGFFGADLEGADFTDAILGGTDFLKANLSGVTWVDGVTICPPGSIGQCN